jgi:uncharacterized protein (DUF1697 family)
LALGVVIKQARSAVKNYVILLRGVTRTGKNRVPMVELRTALRNAALLDVQTYIQSGNVVAKSRLDQSSIQSLVHEIIAREIGADIAVIARTHDQLKHVLEDIPFPQTAASRTYFSLLAAPPASHLIDDLRQLDFSPGGVKVIGNTIYTLYATKHRDSKFNNNFFERKLRVTATTRNFNTMSRLVELSS